MTSRPRTTMNCYEILGVSESADLKDINSAYKKLALKYHPDKTTADDARKFQKINDAVEILRDENRRRSHDVELEGRRAYMDYRDYMEENINISQPGTSSGKWTATAPDLCALRSMRGRYMYSYANSVHMDPHSPESQEEIRRCEREREYGEQLRRECEQWEAYEGDLGHSEYMWAYAPELEEEMRQTKRREAMRVNVMHDEERMTRCGVVDGGKEQDVCFEEEDIPGTSVECELGEVDEEGHQQYEQDEGYEEEEYYESEERYEEYEVYEGGKRYEAHEEYYEEDFKDEEGCGGGGGCKTAGKNRGEEAEEAEEEDDSANSITSTQQTQAEYESARQALDSDVEDLLDMASAGDSVDAEKSIGGIPEVDSDTDENETFHSLSDEEQVHSNGDKATSHGAPTVESAACIPSHIDPFASYFRGKLNHPSGRYTEEDLHIELRGLVMESFCGWLEDIRRDIPGAEPAETVNNLEQCRHLGYWKKDFESSECEACHRWMPIYTLSCPGCGVKACIGCKFQYEK
ncbi:hypothetical protein BDV28DRAFT_158384 [Aspergillus coremiiformis]|uniref:J domain-containing protein n=1 Tax=Aspergillus coremiiformis TaxID=138285 RepID=A0A5N6Z5A8_9EURO|nr:hypothetical protein BDV28DRAFT_158384 [Aspergillus coremiiformis]